MIKNPVFFLGGVLMVISLLILPAMAQNQSVSDTKIPFNETITGDRNVGQYFTFTIQNVSKQADIVYHYTVYAYRLIGTNYSYHSRGWNTWIIQDAAPGSQYLVIWIKGWSEGTTWLGWGPGRFNAWVNGNITIAPEPVHLEDLPIAYRSERFRPVLIADLFNRTENGNQLTTEWYGWKDGFIQERMEPGESNAWDGILIYQVPVSAAPADIRIAGWFGYFGTAIWNLEDIEIDQVSIEKQRIEELELINSQRLAGLRVSDRQRGRNRG